MAEGSEETVRGIGYLPVAEAPTERRRPGRSRITLLAVGIALLLGGGVFAATQIGRGSGADTPAGAVDRLFDALNDEDFLGVLESLAAGERDALVGPTQNMVAELKRLEVLSGAANLRAFKGIDLRFSGLRYETTQLTGTLAAVKITRGKAEVTLDPGRLPLGAYIRETFADDLAEAEPTTDSDGVPDGDSSIVTVKEGGEWRVSLWYSVAESARLEAGLPLPDPAERLVARGAASPEAAVDEFVRAGARFDVKRLFELLPPDEARALHDYAPLFLGDVISDLAGTKRNVTVTIRSLKSTVERNGGQALVKLTNVAFDLTSRDPAFTVKVADGCVEIRNNRTREVKRECGDAVDGWSEAAEFFGVPAPRLSLGQPDLGFVVVEREGQWYVSPTRTFLEGFNAILAIFDRQDLDELTEFFQNVAED